MQLPCFPLPTEKPLRNYIDIVLQRGCEVDFLGISYQAEEAKGVEDQATCQPVHIMTENNTNDSATDSEGCTGVLASKAVYMHEQWNRFSRPGNHQTNACCMVPEIEMPANAISEFKTFLHLAWIIDCLAWGGGFNRWIETDYGIFV